MIAYLDTSALVKRYVAETGSAFITQMTHIATGNEIWNTTITCVEIIAAFYRRVRIGSLTSAEAASAEQNFRQDLHGVLLLWDVSPSILSQAMALAKLHSLRAYDSIQLATAVDLLTQRRHGNLPPVKFLSSDQVLNQAALAEGLLVDDPNRYP